MSSTYQAWKLYQNSSTNDEKSPEILHNLVLETVSKQAPGPGQALVRIHAAALNYRDLLIVSFSPKYPVQSAPGISPCADGAGAIEVVGPNSKWNVGDEVIFRISDSWDDGDISNFKGNAIGSGDIHGTLSQYLLVDDSWLVRKPKHLTWEQAASIAGAGGTAINALFHNNGVSNGLDLSGKTVLTQGTGGSSIFSAQFALAAGAKVIATTSSDSKVELLKKTIGVHEVINYKTHPAWADEVLKVTDGRGVDLVIDVGGSGTFDQSLKAARLGGTIAAVGFMTDPQPSDPSFVHQIIFGAKTSEYLPTYLSTGAYNMLIIYDVQFVVNWLPAWRCIKS